MGLKEGYKQTEVGVIPEDWDYVNLSTVSTLKARIGWQGLTTKEYLTYGDYYLITGTDFLRNRVYWKGCFYVDKSRYDQDTNIQVRNGDLLITKDGTIGKVAYVENITKPATLNSGIFVLRPKQESYLAKYLFYVFASKYFTDFLRQLTAGSTITHLYQRDFINFYFLLPPLPEQKAIAIALSDIDGLINSLTKLIEKKKNIKQGAMQELLTGKKRLEGFSGVWVEKQLGEIGKINMCKRIFANQTNASGDIPFYKIGTFGKQPDAHISRALYEEYAKKYSFPNKGDILLSAAGTTGRTVVFDGTPSYFQDSNIVWIEIDKSEICNEYLYHYYQVIEWAASEGSTISRLYNGIIKATNIKFPPTLVEQTAIATILSDMDSEIEKLQAKLEKYKAIKQGMMQELLTGRIRLLEGA